MTYFTRLIQTLLFAVLPLCAFSQKYWEFGIGGGLTNYLGDLVEPKLTFVGAHPSAQFSFRRSFDGQHSLRINGLYGKISGSDDNYERNSVRGTSFESDLFEAAVIGEVGFWQPKRMEKRFKVAKVVLPYLMLGISAAYGDPEVTYVDPNNRDAQTDYINLHIGIPVGLGVRARVAENFSVGLEWSIRATISDFMDGVQATGNAYKNDSYVFAGMMMAYRFNDRPKTATNSTAAPKK